MTDRIKKRFKYVPVMLFIVLIIFLFPLFKDLEVSDILNYSPESTLLAALILLGIYCLKSVAVFIPLSVLYISAGIMFPTGWAIALTFFCLFCEMSIGYFIGKRMGGEKVAALMEKNSKTRKLLFYHEKNNSMVCFIARILPLPFDLVNMFFGATGRSYPQFIAISLLGLTPKMIPKVLIGNAASNPLSKQFLIPFVICGIVAMCTFFLYQKWRKDKTLKDNDNGTKEMQDI